MQTDSKAKPAFRAVYEYFIDGRWWTVRELAELWGCDWNAAYVRALTRCKGRRKRRAVVA